jgi:hypothetical protein
MVFLVVAVIALLPAFVFVFGAPSKAQDSLVELLKAAFVHTVHSVKRGLIWLFAAALSGSLWYLCLAFAFGSQ